MFTKAEIICGISGFIIIPGILAFNVITIIIGMFGITISTKLHELD